jgi:putative addiction module killer protein
MEVLPIVVGEYVLPGGRRPFSEWLECLRDGKARTKVENRLSRLQTGNFGDCRILDSIFELRIDYGPGYRIYCGKKNDAFVVLLAGGNKKTQDADIQTAKAFWKDYKKRASG